MVEPLLIEGGVGVTVLHDLSSEVVPVGESVDCIFVLVHVRVVMLLLVGNDIFELLGHGIRGLKGMLSTCEFEVATLYLFALAGVLLNVPDDNVCPVDSCM